MFTAKEQLPLQHVYLQLKNFTGLPFCQSLLPVLDIEFGLPIHNLLVETIRKNDSVVMLAAGYNKPEVINAHGGSVGNLKSQIWFL